MPRQSEAIQYGDPRCAVYKGFCVPKRNLGTILDARKAEGVTHKGFAQQCDVSPDLVRRWIVGSKYMTNANVARAARILNVSPLCLLDFWQVRDHKDHNQMWADDSILEADYDASRNNMGLICKFGKTSDITYSSLSVDGELPAINSVSAMRLPPSLRLGGAVHPLSTYMELHVLSDTPESLREYYCGKSTRPVWDDSQQAMKMMTYEEELKRHNEQIIRSYPADLRDLRQLMGAVLDEVCKDATGERLNRLIEMIATR